MAGSFPVFRGFGGIDRRTFRCNGKSHANERGSAVDIGRHETAEMRMK